MFRFLRLLVCVFSGCMLDQGTCVCKRCGRVKHLKDKTSKLMDISFELCGQDKYGRMIYVKTQNYLCTCSRCGAQEIKATHTLVAH